MTTNQIDDKKIREYALHDAGVDNDNHPDTSAFSARLVELAVAVNNTVVASTVADFKKWAKDAQEKFTEMASNVPGNDGEVSLRAKVLNDNTMAKLEQAKSAYARKIIQLSKDKIAWEKRFGPELFAKLDEPVKKNIHLLVGLIVILLAVESIANSQFFAQASEFGLLGGTLTAITVSMGNVGIPLVLAFFGHHFFYRHDSYRYLGHVMIALFFLWALGFNYAVAQYRESTLSANDADTLNFVLLFVLGAAVAGISFWKMWSYLDPYRDARKSLDDLENTRHDFRKTVCADVVEEQEKYEGIGAEIKEQDAGIPVQFKATKANYDRVHDAAVTEAKAVFTKYYKQYAPPHVDPDPNLPQVTPESAGSYGVGIASAEWKFVDDMKEILDGQLNKANEEWVVMLQKILERIADIIRRINAAIAAVLDGWHQDAQAA